MVALKVASLSPPPPSFTSHFGPRQGICTFEWHVMSGGDCFSQTAGADITGHNYWLFATTGARHLGAFEAKVAFRSAYPWSWGCSASCWVGPALFMFYSGHAHTKSFQVFEEDCRYSVQSPTGPWERDCSRSLKSPTGLRERPGILCTVQQVLEKATGGVVGTGQQVLEKETGGVVCTVQQVSEKEAGGIVGTVQQVLEKETGGVVCTVQQVSEKEAGGIVCTVQQVLEKETGGVVCTGQQVSEKETRHRVQSPTGL